MSAATVIFLDDDLSYLEEVERWMRALQVPHRTTQNINQCLEWVRAGLCTLLVADLKLNAADDGIAVVEKAKQIDSRVDALLISSFELTAGEKKRARKSSLPWYSKVNERSRIETRILSHIDTEAAVVDGASAAVGLRLRQYREAHEKWIAHLVGTLDGIMDASSAQVQIGDESITVDELIEEIRDMTPRGMEYIDLYQETLAAVLAIKRGAKE